MSTEAEYLFTRERQERERAASCTDVAARHVHLDLARRYRERAAAAAVDRAA